MGELARTAPRGAMFRVYLVGGGTAVLAGWRSATIDADLCADRDEVFRDIQGIKERLQLNIRIRPAGRLRPGAGGHRGEAPIHRTRGKRRLLSLRSVRAGSVEGGAGVSQGPGGRGAVRAQRVGGSTTIPGSGGGCSRLGVQSLPESESGVRARGGGRIPRRPGHRHALKVYGRSSPRHCPSRGRTRGRSTPVSPGTARTTNSAAIPAVTSTSASRVGSPASVRLHFLCDRLTMPWLCVR